MHYEDSNSGAEKDPDTSNPEHNQQKIDADFLKSLTEALESETDSRVEEHVFRLATLFVDFEFDHFIAEIRRLFNVTDTELVRQLVDNNCERNNKGRYCLFNTRRSEAIISVSMDQINELLDKIDFTGSDWRQNLLNRMLRGSVTSVSSLRPWEYIQAYLFLRWIKHPDIELPQEKLLLELIEKNDILSRFQKLTVYFNGREKELNILRDFVFHQTGKDNLKQPPDLFLSIFGVGGVGKSTLVYQFIQQALNEQNTSVLPFVYFDFDTPDCNVSNIFTLIRDALKQLAKQRDHYSDRFNHVIRVINEEFGNSESSIASRSSDRAALLVQVLTENDRKMLASMQVPVLVVLDSFEELKLKSKDAEINVLYNTLMEMSRFIPTLRVLIVGRSEYVSDVYSFRKLELSAFEENVAVPFLGTLGITTALAQDIFRRFGGNPLNLQLAANLVITEMGTGNCTVESVLEKGIFDKIDNKLIQQQLVARNLDHIPDPEVAAIAVPGLLLRKINPDIIKEVLANICGLGKITLEKAIELFEKLKTVSFLVQPSGNQLEFRKDVRTEQYNLILKDPRYKAMRVHLAAAAYYRHRDKPEEQSEYLFHCLKLGRDYSIIDNIYKPAMKPYLESALSELSPEARVYLSNKMGVGTTNELLQEVSQENWELFLQSQIQSLMEYGDEQQLEDMVKRLKERTARTGKPMFTYYEKLLYTRLMRSSKANQKEQAVLPELLSVPERSSIFDNLARIYVLEFLGNYGEAYQLINQTEQLLKDNLIEPDQIPLWINLFCSKVRIEVRDGKNFGKALSKKSNLQQQLENSVKSLALDDLQSVFALFPRHLQLPLQKKYLTRFPDHLKFLVRNKYTPEESRLPPAFANISIAQCLEIINTDSSYLTAKEFWQGLEKLNSRSGNFTGLETYARRIYGIYLKDICLPGTFEVCLHDLVLFAEVMPRTADEPLIRKLTDINQFTNKTGVAVSDDFIYAPEVRKCIERLEKTFTEDGKRKLIVSDIIDNEGHQYVNLVMRANGVHCFALMGYTFILEKMGIRFIRTAGMNSAAINAALMSVTAEKEEKATIKLLNEFSGLRYSNIVDGSFISRFFQQLLIRRGNIFNRALTFSAIVLTALIVFSVIFFIFSFTNTFKSESKNILLPVIAAISGYMGLFTYFGWSLVRKLSKFGAGLNSGNALLDWITSIFTKAGVNTTEDFNTKISKVPQVVSREGTSYNIPMLKGELALLCGDIVSQNRIVLPEMAKLFFTKDRMNTIHPAVFVRAASSIPVFQEAVIIEDIPVENEEIRSAWLKTFGEYTPPNTVCLVDCSTFSSIPISIFQDTDPVKGGMPTFGVEITNAADKLNTKDIRKLSGIKYFQRLFDSSKYVLEEEQVTLNKLMESGVTRVFIDGITPLNFFLTDREKIELFIKGAVAATEFLVSFNWEDYKRQVYGTASGVLK